RFEDAGLGIADVGRNRLTGKEGIFRRRDWRQFVEFVLQREGSSLGADIGKSRHRVADQVALHIEMPLLDVGPDPLVWNRSRGQRKQQSFAADVVVAGDVVLGGGLHD